MATSTHYNGGAALPPSGAAFPPSRLNWGDWDALGGALEEVHQYNMKMQPKSAFCFTSLNGITEELVEIPRERMFPISFRMEIPRKRMSASLTIQRFYRGWLGRKKYLKQISDLEKFMCVPISGQFQCAGNDSCATTVNCEGGLCEFHTELFATTLCRFGAKCTNRSCKYVHPTMSQGSGSQGSWSQGNRSQGNRSQGNRSQGNRTQGNRSQGNRTQGSQTQGSRTQSETGRFQCKCGRPVRRAKKGRTYNSCCLMCSLNKGGCTCKTYN